eukprot:1761160-Rhodomonas_salina.1
MRSFSRWLRVSDAGGKGWRFALASSQQPHGKRKAGESAGCVAALSPSGSSGHSERWVYVPCEGARALRVVKRLSSRRVLGHRI